MISSGNGSAAATEVDVAVVGAGFSGLYMLHRLRGLGFSAMAFDEAGDVGGTWYWNRYPGARCDIPTTDYAYSFDPQLEKDWNWSEKYATQPEILAYLRHVADRYDLRRDIRFGIRITSADWDEASRRWRLRTDHGDEVRCRYYIMASGCLSLPKSPDIEGVDRYRGEVYLTGRWPHDSVDFSGKTVAVVGTGSSGIQCIPLIAGQAAAADRLPANAELLGTRPQRPAATGPPRRARRGSRRLPRGRALVPRRSTGRAHRRQRPDRTGRSTPAAFRERLAGRRAVRDPRSVQRPGRQPGLQRTRRRDDPGEDTRDRQRPGHRRGALPEGLPVRHQAPVPGHQLLRDLQPAARPAGRPAQDTDRRGHRGRHRHGR